METEADIAEAVPISKNVGESAYLERLVGETIPGEVKIFQGMLNLPPETAQHSAETENKQAAIEPETMITIIEGNVETAKGEKFFESPYAVEVAGEETCRVSKHCQDEEVPIQEDKEITEDEKQVRIKKIEVGDGAGSGGIKIMPEPEEIPEKNDMSSDIVNLSGNGFQIEKIEESNLRIGEEISKEESVVDQHAEVIIDQDVSVEDKSSEKETIDMHKKEKDGILEATGETGSEKADKFNNLVCQEKTPEPIEACEAVEDEKDEREMSVCDNAREMFTPSIAAHPDIKSDKEATLNIKDGVEETVYKPSITTATESGTHEAGPEAGEELKEASGVACEEKSQDVTEPSEEIKYITQVEDEMSQKDSIDTFATQTEETCSEKVDNPRSFKVPSEIQSDDIIKEIPEEVEQIEVIERTTKDDSISRDENPEQKGDASFLSPEGTLSVNEEVAAADASSGENRYEEGSTVIETKENSDDTEIIDAVEQEEEKLERSMSVVNEDFIVSACAEHTEKIACVTGEESIKVQEERFDDKIADALEDSRYQISDIEERPENLQQNKPEKEKIEESWSVVAADFSMVAPTESAETTTGDKGKTPIESQEESCEEILKEDSSIHTDTVTKKEIAEDKNISSIELNEKIECAQVEVKNPDAIDLHVTDPLIEAAVENEGKTSDSVPNFEAEGQVREANEASMEEEKHTEDAPEAHQSGNCILEHPSTEGGVTTEQVPKTSKAEVEKLQEAYSLESEEKSVIKDSGEKTDPEMQNNEEACDSVKPELVAESDDAVKSTTDAETPIEINSAIFTTDEKIEQELQAERPLKAEPALKAEDESYLEDNNERSNATSEEVHDGKNITGSGVPVNEKVMEGFAPHISEETIRQEINQVTPENKNKAEKSEGENIIEETSEESNPASVEQVPEDLQTAEIFEISKTQAVAESIEIETGKNIESSEEITATETSVEEKPHKNEPGEKLEQPFSSNENETFSSDADKIPCLAYDGAPQNLEETPQKRENEKELEENNNAKENKITADEEDLEAVAEASDATRSTESIALELKSEIDNMVIEDEINKEESKEINEDGKEAGKQTLKEENLVDQSSELEVEKIEQSVNEDHAVACISPESAEQETVEISGENGEKENLEETNITGQIPESVEQVPLKNTEDNEKKAEDSTAEIFETSKTGEGAEIIENKTSNTIECTKEILDTTQGKQESVQSEEKYMTATESSPEEKPQENVPEEKLERTLSLVSGQNETLRSDVREIQCLVQEGASRDLEEAPQNEEKETEDYNDTKENKIAMEEDVQVLDEATEASQSTENIALDQRSEIDNITIENETKKEETKESEDLKDTEKDEEIEKHDPIGGGGPTTILLEPIGEKVLQSSEGDEKEEETHKIEGCAQLETTSIHEDGEKETPEEENILDKSSELEGEKLEQGFNGDHAVAACISSESVEQETVEISGENSVNQTLEETNIARHVPESVEQIPLKSTEDGEKKAEDSTREIIEKPKMEEEAESIENETSITIDCPEENVQSEGKNISATESSPEKKSQENESGEEIERPLPSVSDESESFSSDADKIQCLVGEGASQSLEETPQIEEKETEEDIDTKKNKIATENLQVLDERTEASKGIESIAPELQSETDNKAVEDEIKEECKQSEELKDTEKGEKTVQHDSAEEYGTATTSPEPIREKVLQSSEGDEKEEQTPEIEASAQLETISVHEDAEKQTPEEENIVKQSSELEGEKIEQSLDEDQVAARISSESVEQEVVEIPEETTITGHVSESVEQVPFKNIEDNEKKAEGSTGEIIENAKTEEKSESIENETSRTIVCPKEILDTTQGYPGENVQSEGKSITATESSPDEKSRENESEEKIERTLPLVYDEIESFSSDANEIQCPAKEGASQNLEEVPQNKEKETKACKSSESKALSEIDNIAGVDEIKKEECEESEDLKDTEEDEETEKHDSVEDSGVTTVLPEAVGEKVVQSSEEDKKEEETPKFEACAQLETASLDEDAEKETLKEESIVDQSRELEVEKIEQSYREEDTPRFEACSLLETTSGDEDAGKEDPEKENIVEQSRELEIEKIEESSKEDNAVAYISSGSIEQETVTVSQGNENKAEESEGDNNIEQIVEESSIRSLIPESVQQVPIFNLINEEKKAQKTTGENFEDSKTVEAAECIENETNKTIESLKEHGEDVQSEGKNITATESSPAGKPQENKPGDKLEQTLSLVSGQNETSSSDVNKIQCLVEDGASQNLEEAKGNEEKEKEENNDTKENKITSAEELQVLDETTKASKSNENIALEARPEIDDIAVEDEIKKEEPKESEELKDTEKDEETEKHDSAEECGTATILPEPIGEKVLQSSAEDKKEEQTPKIEACERLETTSVDEEDKKEEETPKFEACAQLEITGLEEDEEKETLKEERIVDQSRELEVEKIEQSSKEEETPRIEACSQLETMSGDEDAGKEDPAKENIVEQSRELEIEKIEESSKEDNAIAYISSGSIEQETVKVSQGNENKAEESGENNIEQIVKESSIRGLIAESVQQVPIVNLINEEKKDEETTGENFGDSKTVEAAECIENETCKTIESPKEMLDTMQRKSGEDVHGEGKNITATESSPEEKPQENEPGEKLEQTLSLVSGQNETSSSDVNKIQCLVEDGASQNLEEAKGNEEKETEENNDTKENKMTLAEDLQVLDKTTEASKSNENMALEAWPEIDDLAVEDEIKKEEPKESEELKDTGKDEETEKDDSAKECGAVIILPEPIGEKVLQSSAGDKKEEQTHKIEACEQIDTTNVDEEAEKQTPKEETTVDQSRELEVEKIKQSYREEETPRFEACSQRETTSIDQSAGKDLKKENIVEQSRELEIEKIAESSKEDNTVANISSGERATPEISQGIEIKAEESEGENNIEQIVEESSIRGFIPESVEQVPIDNLTNEEKKVEETTGENFEDSKTVEAAECIENETSKTIGSPKEILYTTQGKQGEDVQSDGKNIKATESSPEEKPQENEPGEKLEQASSFVSGQNETSSSDANKIQCLMEDGSSQNLEKAKGNEEKETEENNDTKENKITSEEDLQVLDETTEASKSNEKMVLEARPEIDDIAVEDEKKKEEPKESEELKDTGMDEETEECCSATILPEPIEEKLLQSSAEDKKEEQTHKIELETTSVDEEAENQSPQVETTVDQSREIEVEKIEQSSREEETPGFEACSQLETTSVDENAGKEDLEKADIVEQSRELEIEKIEESSKEDNTVACISSGERETIEICQGNEIKAEKSEGETIIEQIVEESSIRGLIPESVEQVPIDNLITEEKKAEETTGENFEDSKAVEASECIENETSKTIESPKEILDTTHGKQGEDVQSEGKNLIATTSSPEEKPQDNEPGHKLEQTLSLLSGQNETSSSDANKIQCLVEDGASQNLEEAKGNEEKQTEENDDTKENKLTSEKDLQALDETTEASKSNENIALEARPEIDDIAIEDEIKKEEPKESEEPKDTEKDEETEKRDSAEECGTATILPEPIGEKLLQSSAEYEKEEQTPKIEACEQLETTSVDEEDKKEEETPKFEACAQLVTTSLEEDEEKETLKEERIVDQTRELEVEKIGQSSKDEETPRIEACSQLETTSGDEVAGKEDLEKENIGEQSRELEIEKIEESSKEDNAVAYISSGLIAQETVKVSQGNENKAEESEGENNIEQIVEESSIKGLIPESVQQVPIVNLINEEKKAEETTGENFDDSKTVEAAECIENETSKTIESPKEMLDTTQGIQGEDVQSEGKSITATESSPEEKPRENEHGEKLEQTLSLVSSQNEAASSDANKMQCLVEDGASENLEEAKGIDEKETEENNGTNENKKTSEEDLQVIDETTEASKSNENIALEVPPEIDDIAVEDETKKEETKESKELKDTENEETEKHDSAEERVTATILPEPIGEKVLQSSAEDKKEEETPKIEACEQLETASVDEEAEKQTLKEETIVDESRELEAEKIEQSSREEETPRIEACSKLETTSVDENAGKEDLEKENVIEHSRELEIEKKIEESSKEDNTVAYISSGEQETVEISQGNEIKAEESEGENKLEQIVEESRISGLIPESVQQVPIDKVNEEKKEEELTGENFENAKTLEAAESIENETSKMIENPKEILDNTQEKQGVSMRSEIKTPAVTESMLGDKPQKNESGEKLEHEILSSDGDKIPSLIEEEAPRNLEEVPKKEDNEKQATDFNETKDSKKETNKDLEVVAQASDEGNSAETIVLKLKSGVDNIVVEDELKKEESKPLCEDCKDGVNEKHDITEECSTANILPEPLGEKILPSSEDTKEEETPKFEACAQLETTNTDKDAEKQTLEGEIIIDQSRELEAEKIEKSSGEEETPRIEACSQLETTSVDKDPAKEDLEKVDIVDQSRELEIEKIKESSKEENTVAHISSESTEQETVEISQGNENMVENSEGKNKIEHIIEESSTRGLIPEPVQQVPLNNLVDEEKKTEKTSAETYENSKREEAAESIAHETSETIESHKEILDTFQVTQVESLHSEGKNQTATESSVDEKINEDKSPVIVAEENNNDSELVDDKDNSEMKVSKDEDDIEQCSQKNEAGEEIEQPLSLTSDENQAFSSDIDKITHLMEEGTSQNPKEAQKKEINEKETEESNDTEDKKVPKEEVGKDLQVADEQSDARESTGSTTWEQKLEMEHMEVEEKKEVSKELYEDCNDAGKEKETQKHDIQEECSSTNVLREPIEEKVLHSSEQDKKEEETSKIEACVPLETTIGDEDAEKQTLKENMVKDSRELGVEIEQISKEDDSAEKVSKQEGHEAAQTVDGDEDAGKQNIGGDAENKSKALETADSIPSREKQDIEEDDKQGFLCSSVKEETVKESSQEDESKDVKLKEEVDESDSSSIEKTEVTSSKEETFSETLNDSVESKADSYPLNVSKAPEEELPPKEIHGGPVEKSPMVLDVSDKYKEITAKEEINIDDVDSATVKVVTEEVCLMEAEPEEKKQVESFAPFEEKGIVETEAKEIMLENIDSNVKPEDISNLGEKRQKEIPPNADQAREEIDHKTENEVPHAGSEDQTTNELSLKEISREVDYSTITEENELVTSKASEAIDETTAESHAPYEDTEITSVARAIDTVVMEKQDRTTCLSNVSELEPVNTGKGTADKEVQQERVEDLYVHHELDHEKSLSASEDVQTSEKEETRELADHSDGCTSKTLEDVESSNVTPNIDEGLKSIETSVVCTESEKSILEQDILKGISEERIEVEKAAIELKEEAHSQRQEDIDSKDTGTQTEEIFKSADPEERVQHDSEVVAGDQSSEILPQSVKSQIEENCNDNQIEEAEKEIKEKEEQKLEVEDQKEQTANETAKAVLITEKMHEGVEECDDSEDIKKLVVEEVRGFNEIHALSIAGETTDKVGITEVQDSSLVYAKVEDSKEKTETEKSEVEEVSTMEREAFFSEQPEKQKVEDSSTSIEPPGEESKRKIEEEVIEESQYGYHKIDNKTLTTMTEKSPEEAEPGDKLVKAFHTDLDEPCLETTEIVHNQQCKQVDSMKLETSCDLASELQTKSHGHAESESITTENTDMSEPEEIKTAFEAVYESKGQGQETVFGKSLTVEKPDQVSTDDHDADRKNVIMENSDTDEVDATKLALDAVDMGRDQGDSAGKSLGVEEADQIPATNSQDTEKENVAEEKDPVADVVSSDVVFQFKDQGIGETGKSPNEEKLDADRSEEGCTETTNNRAQGVETVTEDDIIAEQTPSAEKLEQQLQTPASELPLKHGTTTTVVKIEEEKMEKVEILEDAGSEDYSTAKPAEESSLQNDGPEELEVPTLESTNFKDIEDSPTEKLVREEGRQTSDDAIQLKPPENEKIKCLETEESLSAETPDESEEACKETSVHKAQGVGFATEGGITAEQTPLTEKLEEQPLTPTSALLFTHGTTATVEKIEEEKTEKMEILEEEDLEDSSAAKQPEGVSLLKDSPTELEVPALGSTSNKDDSLTDVLVHEEGGQTPVGGIQVEPSGNETTVKCVDASSESKEIIDLSTPAETAYNLKSETNEKDLEPELVLHRHEELLESRDTEVHEKHLGVITGERDEENLSKQTSQVNQIIQNEVSKEEITEEKDVGEKYQPSSLYEEKLNESLQEVELKPEECKGETTDRTTETIVTRIQDEELSGEAERAIASEKIGKQVSAEDRSVEDSDQVSVENRTIKDSFPHEFERKDVENSAIELDSRNQGEESIKGFEEGSKLIQETQKSEETFPATTEKQISTEADITKCPETIVSTGREYVPPVLQEGVTETLQKVEAEDFKPGNSEGFHSEVKEVEHGGEKRTDFTEEETTDKSTLADSDKHSLSYSLQRSTEETIQLAKDVIKEKEPTASAEGMHPEEAETIKVKEEKSHEKKEEAEGDEHQKTDSGSDAPVMVEASGEMDVKVTHKKSHGILSGVSSKVKHSISKVKKAITGKSSHHSKPVSPK